MTSIRPTSTSPTDSAFIVSPLSPARRARAATYPRSFSPSIKPLLQSRYGSGHKYRPNPIVVPSIRDPTLHTAKRGRHSATPRRADGRKGSVPYPKTPRSGESSAKTAVPYTARRVGTLIKQNRGEVEVELAGLEAGPVLMDEPSPGWAEFEALSLRSPESPQCDAV